MYRVLAGTARCVNADARPPTRRKEARAGRHGPNQVWAWDITKLLGPEKWTYFYLYVVIDIFSRYVPGWMLARAENAELAEALLADTIAQAGHRPRRADHPRRPWLVDGLQAGGATCSPTSVSPRAIQPPALLERQPVLRKQVPHPQIPA